MVPRMEPLHGRLREREFVMMKLPGMLQGSLRGLLLLCVGVTLQVTAASAAVLTLTDPFTDGVRAGGSDNSGILWYDRSTSSTMTIVNDAVIGTGNALELTLTNTTVTSRGFMGVLSGLTLDLLNTGDSINLTFDFRFIPTAINSGGTTTAPGSSNSGLTFGLYNSNGTISGGDNSMNQDNDFGFRADFGTGANSNIFIGKEDNTTSGTAGGTGTTSSGDTLTVGLNPGSIPVNINDFEKHSAQFRLTKSAAGVDILVGFDGNTVATGTSVAPFTSFDEIMFSQGGGSSFRIDNVVLTFTPIPEPGGVLLAIGGVAGLLVVQRRRAAAVPC